MAARGALALPFSEAVEPWGGPQRFGKAKRGGGSEDQLGVRVLVLDMHIVHMDILS